MRRLALIVILVVLSGCDAVQEQAEQAGRSLADFRAAEIGNLASSILDDPSRAEDLLESSGITAEDLDSMLYEIATDAEAREEYLEALGAR